MIIPIRCFTCGKVIADKWREYEKRCAELDTPSAPSDGLNTSRPGPNADRHGLYQNNPRDKILNELGLTRMCCRRHMLTHVDLHNHA